MTHVVTLVGARPQFVKAAVVSNAMERSGQVEECLVHSGQHYDLTMSDVFFDELDIPEPKYHLGVGSASHAEQTGRILIEFEQVLLEEKPDWVVVYGDTNTTMAGALAAIKLHVPVAHVEAGLRSFNRRMPEEVNRIVTDSVSELLFAPTEAAVRHLVDEGYPTAKIERVGDVMFDVVRIFSDRAQASSDVIRRLELVGRDYCLVTVHRAENTDASDRLRAIVDALIRLSEDLDVIVPLHPRTAAALEREGMLRDLSRNVCVVEPVGYLDMLVLEKNARLILTDSGGVQKEAFFHGVPCLTVREETEWVELIETGWNRLADPSDSTAILSAARNAIGTRGSTEDLYGDGHAAEKIVHALEARGLQDWVD